MQYCIVAPEHSLIGVPTPGCPLPSWSCGLSITGCQRSIPSAPVESTSSFAAESFVPPTTNTCSPTQAAATCALPCAIAGSGDHSLVSKSSASQARDRVWLAKTPTFLFGKSTDACVYRPAVRSGSGDHLPFWPCDGKNRSADLSGCPVEDWPPVTIRLPS